MGKADLHIHSHYSDGRESIERILRYVDGRLDVIAITDHDVIDGALRARDLVAAGGYRVEVVPGIEISTRDGHLLALNVERVIPAGLKMAETVQAIHEMGGVAVVAHPLSRWCPSASLETLLRLAEAGPGKPDGLEVRNGSFAGVGSNGRAAALNASALGWAATAGSDAHTLLAISACFTQFPGQTAADLLAAIREHVTTAKGGLWALSEFAGYLVHSAREKLSPDRRLPAAG